MFVPFGQSSMTGLSASQCMFGQTSSSTGPERSGTFGESSMTGPSSSQCMFGQTSSSTPSPLFCGFSDYSTRENAFGGASTGPAMSSSQFSSSPSFDAVSAPPLGFQQAQPAFGYSPFTPMTNPSIINQPAYALQLPMLLVPQTPVVSVSQQPQNAHHQFPQQNLAPQPPHHLGLQHVRCSIVLDFGYQLPQNSEPQPQPSLGPQNVSSYSSPFAIGAQIPFHSQGLFAGDQTAKATLPAGGFHLNTSLSRRRGSRVATYTSTPSCDIPGNTPISSIREENLQNLKSISAMPIYEWTSHDELRWEDYRHGDKGGRSQVNPSLFASRNTPAPKISDSESNRFHPTVLPDHFRSLRVGESTPPACIPASTSVCFPATTSVCTSDRMSGTTLGPSNAFSQSRASGFSQLFPSSFGTPSSSSNAPPFRHHQPLFGTIDVAPAFSSSPSIFCSHRGSGSGFSFCQAAGTVPSSSFSPFGSTTTAPPSNPTSGVLHSSSSVESSTRFGSPPAFAVDNAQSFAISQTFTPRNVQKTSLIGHSASGFHATDHGCSSSDPFNAVSNSAASVFPTGDPSGLDQTTQLSLSAFPQPAAAAQTSVTAPVSILGWMPPASLYDSGSPSSVLGTYSPGKPTEWF